MAARTTAKEVKAIDMKVRLTLLEDALGLSPADENILSKYISSNAPDAKSKKEEIAEIGAQKYEEKNTTIFPKTSDGVPFFWDYQIKGFFKDSTSALKRSPGSESEKIKAYKKYIDGTIFTYPRRIMIDTHGEPLGNIQRPLRAQTPVAEITAIASSETVPAGSTIDLGIILLASDKRPWVIELLDYGMMRGLAQWRNAGYGRFDYEILSEETIDLQEARKRIKEGVLAD